MKNLLIGVIVAYASCLPALALDMQGFKDCVGYAGAAPECELDPGPGPNGAHVISQTIDVQRSNILIHGDWTGVTLQRALGFPGALMSIGAGLSNVRVQNFTFDGNRDSGTFAPNNGDLEIHNCNSCRVNSNQFVNSPHIALAVSPGAFNTIVRYNLFSRAYHFGIWSGAGDCNGDPYYRCLYVYSNNFMDVGTNAIFLTSSRANIGYNTFSQNHRECSYDAPGGQIDLDAGATDIHVFWNTISGGPSCANGWWAQGIELHGTRLEIYDNVITQNAGEGIYLEEADTVNIYSTDSSRFIRWNNVRGTGFPGCGQFPGVRIHSQANLPKKTRNRTVRNTSIVDGHSWGVEVSACPQSQQNAENISIQNNCFRGNNNLAGINGVNVPGTQPSGLVISGNVLSGCGPN